MPVISNQFVIKTIIFLMNTNLCIDKTLPKAELQDRLYDALVELEDAGYRY